MLTQEKDKCCRPTYHPRPEQTAVCPVADPPVVACARLATDLQRWLARSLVDAFQTARRACLHHLDQGAAGRRCHLRSEQACTTYRGTGHECFIRCPCRKVVTVKAQARGLDTIVE